MNPIVDTSHPIDRHHTSQIAVEVGSDEDLHYLWKEWDQQHRHKFEWIENCAGKIQLYGELSLEEQQLSAKCNFLKVNDCVLMLLQPHGRFCEYSKLKKQAKVWFQNNNNAITNTPNFHNNYIWEELEKEHLHKNEASFPYGAQSAVIIENEYHLDQFVQYATKLFARRQMDCKLLPQFDVKEYQLPRANFETDTRPMYAHIHAARINDLVVTFFNNSGIYCDRLSLQEKAKEWFPHAQFVSRENIGDLFKILKSYK